MSTTRKTLHARPWAATAALLALAALMLVAMASTAFAGVATYTITPTAGAHGAILPSTPQTVNSGADATFTITPNVGYYVATLTVDAVATAPVAAFTFTNVTANHAISASFAPLAPIEAFNHNPVLSTLQAPGAWYVDRFAPHGFSMVTSSTLGGNVLKESIAASDYQGVAFTNTQGRKYDIATSTVIAADLYIGADWATGTAGVSVTSDDPGATRRADLWGTSLDASGNITGYPIINFVNGTGFRVWDNLGWHNVGYPAGFTYGSWYNLRIQLNSDANSTSYYVGDQLVYVSSWVDDTDMAGTVGAGSVMLQGHNYGGSYDVYWDNALPVPAAAPYGIATSSGSGGAISPHNPTVDWGDDAMLTVAANVGHHLLNVLKDGVSIGASSSVTFDDVTADHTLSATFAPNTFTLAYTAGAHGSIVGSSTQVVDYDTSGLPVTAQADEGYYFVSWSDGPGGSPRTDTHVTASKAVTANFARVAPTLTITECPNHARHGWAFKMRGRVTPILNKIQITRYRRIKGRWVSYGRYNQQGRYDGTWQANVSTNHTGSWKFVVRAGDLSVTRYVTAR